MWLTLCTLGCAVAPLLALWRRRPGRCGRVPADPPQRASRLTPHRAAGLAVGLAVAGAAVRPPWGASVGLLIPIGLVAGRARARRRAARRRQVELDALVTLVAFGMQGGLTIRQATAAALEWSDGPLASLLRDGLRRSARGFVLADELERLVEGAAPELRPFARIVAEAERYGVPAGPALGTLRRELRLERRHRLERDARRLPVRLLGPLIGGVLPAFALLAVVPMLVGGLGGLEDLGATSSPTAPAPGAAADASSRGEPAPSATTQQQGVGP